MSKKKNKVTTSVDLNNRIIERYSRWKSIFDIGCSDPFWSDGVNINLVRNHITYEKHRVEEELKDNYIAYPESYFYPDPVELPNDFIAVDRKILSEDKVLKANKSISYGEAVKFNWGEVLFNIY